MALLVATTIFPNLAGNRAEAIVLLPAVSNNDTWDAGIAGIRTVDAVIVVSNDASKVAADSISATWATSIITFHVAGTARTHVLIVWGRTHPVV